MPTFEENLKALETVVEQLERGDLPLEDSVKLFEQGMALSAACKQDLEAAEGKLQVLMKQQNGKMEAKDLNLE
ncbi:exodeoxyribonuclease VII small subunit [Terriglobus sp. 2YAB30_2]|uniref:Exodeoxyribonuclease 7 small subunit n=1 Tax=Terriglobus albidus TaxID=1592106 RepID=A0A5B9EGB1_9BACT|nr:exodeoxyribonuclease VII small subunit [Terriglobus albidus]QEE30849.1 exodeoxyribonuclease VII small subunit [Terriglobus albidus]